MNLELNLNIKHDELAENPRTVYTCTGTLITITKNNTHDYGELNFSSMEDFYSHLNEEFSILEQKEDYLSDKEIKRINFFIQKSLITLNVFCHNHSGISLSTSPFNDSFDSGQIGIIYYPKNKLKDLFKLTSQPRKHHNIKTQQILEEEIKTLNSYVQGGMLWI